MGNVFLSNMLICIGKYLSINYYHLKILILWLMLLPCYRLMLLPFIEFGRCYNQIDNGISIEWNNLVVISMLMADVIAICG